MKSLEIPKNNYLGGKNMGNNKNEIQKFRKELNKRGFFEDIILDKASLIMYASDAGISVQKRFLMIILNKLLSINTKKLK